MYKLFENNPYQGKTMPVVYITNKYYFSYCKVPKGGSTFWIYAFGVLEYGLKYGETVFSKQRISVHSTINTWSPVQKYKRPIFEQSSCHVTPIRDYIQHILIRHFCHQINVFYELQNNW
jgi:hypothetical protein